MLILGAGGATRGVVEPLLSLGPTELVIANRSPERAVNLASLFVRSGRGTRLRIRGRGRRTLRHRHQRHGRRARRFGARTWTAR